MVWNPCGCVRERSSYTYYTSLRGGAPGIYPSLTRLLERGMGGQVLQAVKVELQKDTDRQAQQARETGFTAVAQPGYNR